jgi:hypothetical protein
MKIFLTCNRRGVKLFTPEFGITSIRRIRGQLQVISRVVGADEKSKWLINREK